MDIFKTPLNVGLFVQRLNSSDFGDYAFSYCASCATVLNAFYRSFFPMVDNRHFQRDGLGGPSPNGLGNNRMLDDGVY